MSKVYVVQNPHRQVNGKLVPTFNLDPAKKHGELVFLLSPSARPFQSEHVVGVLREGLKEYSSDDYLLLIGNPALIGMATAIAAHFNDGSVKLLQWDGVRGEYNAVSVDLRFRDNPYAETWKKDAQ